MIALGTETDGSIICPSSYAALYAIKPTVGLVSRAGVIPISHTQDTVRRSRLTLNDKRSAQWRSPRMTQPCYYPSFQGQIHVIRKVARLRVMLIVALESPANTPTDYTRFTKEATFQNLRLGVPREVFFNVTYVGNQEIIDAVNAAIQKIQSLGAIIQDPADIPSAWELVDSSAEELVLG